MAKSSEWVAFQKTKEHMTLPTKTYVAAHTSGIYGQRTPNPPTVSGKEIWEVVRTAAEHPTYGRVEDSFTIRPAHIQELELLFPAAGKTTIRAERLSAVDVLKLDYHAHKVVSDNLQAKKVVPYTV